MKHTDLMLNDLVMYQGEILRVGCISDYDIKIDLFEDGEDTPYAEIWQEELDEVKPIPLTDEILEKNGFAIEERDGDITFPYLAFIIKNDEYSVEITWYDSHDVYEPNTGKYLHSAPEVWNMEILGKCGNYDCGKNKIFVHELQHALRLCGIDKEIVL